MKPMIWQKREFLVRVGGVIAAAFAGIGLNGTALASPHNKKAALTTGGHNHDAVKQKPLNNGGSKNLPTIAIDAGHGGRDPGAIGRKGTKEKSVTVAVARDLAMQLSASGKFNVILTRWDDMFISLPDRVRLARTAEASLFISLHADSIHDHGMRGFSVYTLSEEASDDLAANLARRENAVDRMAGGMLRDQPPEVRQVLLGLLSRDTSRASLDMAEKVVRALPPFFTPLERPRRQANFAVLRAPDIPSVLVEMGFISNPIDEKLLAKRSYQSKISERLSMSVHRYFGDKGLI